jgi:hypothetical protein
MTNAQPMQLTLTLKGPATIDLSNGEGWLCLERYYGKNDAGSAAPFLRYGILVETSTGYPLGYWLNRIVSGLEKAMFRVVRIDIDYEACGK